jgi:transcriptional regulator with XRE-family HTH domain
LKTIYHPTYVLLVEKLIVERKSSGLTQAQLASKLGKHQSYVAKVEGCERKLDVIELVDWCKALGVVASGYVKDIEKF